MTVPGADWFDVALALGVVGTALLSLVVPSRQAAVMTFLVLGVLLTVVWARLAAPDIALAEAAIASGVTGALLVAATTEDPVRRPGRRGVRGWAAVLAGAGLGVVLALPLVAALLQAPGPVGEPLGAVATRTLDEASISHPVTVVLLEYRAYDTLLEIAVLAAAVLAGLALHRDGGLGDVRVAADDRVQLRLVVRVLTPVLVLLTGWLLVAGATRPGGAFQSGALLAGLLLLLHLTGQRLRAPVARWLRPALLTGLVAFVLLGAATYLLDGRWLAVAGPGAGQVILALEALLMVGIGVGLAGLVLAGRPDQPRGRRASGGSR